MDPVLSYTVNSLHFISIFWLSITWPFCRNETTDVDTQMWWQLKSDSSSVVQTRFDAWFQQACLLLPPRHMRSESKSPSDWTHAFPKGPSHSCATLTATICLSLSGLQWTWTGFIWSAQGWLLMQNCCMLSPYKSSKVHYLEVKKNWVFDKKNKKRIWPTDIRCPELLFCHRSHSNAYSLCLQLEGYNENQTYSAFLTYDVLREGVGS